MMKARNGIKICCFCKKTKAISEFGKNSGNSDGLICRCKECASEYNKVYYRKNKEKIIARHKKWKESLGKEYYIRRRKYFRNGNLKKNYGININEYNSILKSQNGVCAVCGKIERYKNRKYLSVDHNHNTGEVRGLLCGDCNVAIGYVNEDVEILRKMIIYLI